VKRRISLNLGAAMENEPKRGKESIILIMCLVGAFIAFVIAAAVGG
jgi:hypothetical protein